MKLTLLKRIGLVALMALVTSSSFVATAAERLVGASQTYSTIAAAIEAAADGDTIRITDSGVYTETLVINKRLDIVANAGQTPTIRTAAATLSSVITTTGANGGKFGSIDGGKITVDRNQPNSVGTASLFCFLVGGIDTGQTYTIENVYCTGFTTSAIAADQVAASTTPPITAVAYGVRGTLNINYVEMDKQLEASELVSASNPPIATGLRIVGSNTSLQINFGGTFNLLYTKIHRINSHGIVVNHSSSSHLQNITINLNNCEITTLQHGALTLGNNTNLTVNANETLFLGGGGPAAAHSSWECIRYSSNTPATYNPSGNINLTRCVMMLHPERGAQAVIGLRVSPNVNLTMDHCDVIAPLGGATSTLPARARNAIHFMSSTDRNITLTNNIIYGPERNDTNSTTTQGIVLDPTGVENNVVTLNHNNVFVSGTPYSANLTPGANEIIPAKDPMYLDRANWDFRTDNGSGLRTVSSTGGPIGTDRIFLNAVPVELSTFSLQ